MRQKEPRDQKRPGPFWGNADILQASPTFPVITLSQREVQETQAHWLKLISSAAILLLGVVMLFHPDWLS